MKKHFLTLIILLTGGLAGAGAQVLNPVHWTFSAQNTGGDTFAVHLSARIDTGWHVYSQDAGDGPIPTTFTFDDNPAVTLVGNTAELGKELKTFDRVFNSTLHYYENQVDFVQRLRVKEPTTLKGSLEYMVCNDVNCLPPKDVPFSFNLGGAPGGDTASAAVSTVSRGTPPAGTPPGEAEDNASGRSLGWIFWACFAGGFLALLTPCVFSMIPITVSFFTKRSASRALGIRNAVIYSLSIIVIYTLLGFLITVFFGASALNQLASNIWANLAFFVVFLVFGLSFLGAFDISLPSSWATKADTRAGMTSFAGIFFMALTLTIVSFSCTGPIIGNLLVLAARGGRTGPLVGMFGFSLALAIPFALFAVFPAWLQRVGKAGGWLNAVKVVLGLLELAVALKFLSSVDMAYHWGILSKEVFLAIWIVIFLVIGLYLLGKIRFPHDSPVETLSVPRLLFAVAAFAFMVYLIPGLFGRDIKGLVGGFLPTYSSFAPVETPSSAGTPYGDVIPEKYVNIFSRSTPAGYTAFYDYTEAMAAARKLGKPLMIDFTGWFCVNCRKMESEVWTDPAVKAEINRDFILLQLYTDDKTPLPDSLQYNSKFDGSRIKRLGEKNADFEIVHFDRNSQPYYVLLDQEGKMLTSKGYSAQDGYDPSRFLSFLKQARSDYDKRPR